jgi:hypothetical protein
MDAPESQRSIHRPSPEDREASDLLLLTANWSTPTMMHLFAMAAGSRGVVPPTFNGRLWSDQRDEREWGPTYWHWNTQECYWPIFAANHLELHRLYQDMYWSSRTIRPDCRITTGASRRSTRTWKGAALS